MNIYYDELDNLGKNEGEKACATMENVADSKLLLSVLLVHDTFAICSIPCLVLLIQKGRRHPLIHYNTRINQHSTDIYRYLRPRKSGCDILPSVKYCFTIRLPFNCALWTCYSSTIMIAFERLIATINFNCYARNRTIGPIFVICQVCGIINLVNNFF
uniref:G_PROTEIN_RECEP_F1_2 domain-containing protein n=1 Tax=Heterorhabditis bacteriophora TaxID=37862 RepID=A0A1I7XKY2_HETBA